MLRCVFLVSVVVSTVSENSVPNPYVMDSVCTSSVSFPEAQQEEIRPFVGPNATIYFEVPICSMGQMNPATPFEYKAKLLAWLHVPCFNQTFGMNPNANPSIVNTDGFPIRTIPSNQTYSVGPLKKDTSRTCNNPLLIEFTRCLTYDPLFTTNMWDTMEVDLILDNIRINWQCNALFGQFNVTYSDTIPILESEIDMNTSVSTDSFRPDSITFGDPTTPSPTVALDTHSSVAPSIATLSPTAALTTAVQESSVCGVGCTIGWLVAFIVVAILVFYSCCYCTTHTTYTGSSDQKKRKPVFDINFKLTGRT